MDKYGIILIFIFMIFVGWQIFNIKKYKSIWINKVGGLFWIMLGIIGSVVMVIKLLQ